MASPTLRVVSETELPTTTKEILAEVVKPEVARFSEWFSPRTGGPLSAFEAELLSAYLHWKLTAETER